MLSRALLLSVFFTVVEITIFGVFYFLIALTLKGLSLSGALSYVIDVLIGRIVYFQILTQLFLLVLVFRFSNKFNALLSIIACEVSLLLPIVILLRRFSALEKFLPIYRGNWDLGPMWILLTSSTLAWLLIFRFRTVHR